MTFKPVLLAGGIAWDRLLHWGAAEGFAWVELRDFALDLAVVQLREAKATADRLGLRIHYAWDGADVADADPARFLRGIRHAALFGAGTCARVVVAPAAVERATGRYAERDLDRLAIRLEEYLRVAAEHGITLAFENSAETLAGFEALLARVPGLDAALDTANCFAAAAATGTPLSWNELKGFVQRRRGRIPYVHLKSSVAGVVQPDLLAHGDFPLGELLPLLAENAWLCVELPADGDLASCQARIRRGLDTLRRSTPAESAEEPRARHFPA